MQKNYYAIIQLIQNSWWIIQVLLFDSEQNILLCLLSSICIMFRILITIFQVQKLRKYWKFGFFASLANNICYTEINVGFQKNYSFLNHMNTLIIILNYKEQKNKTLTKLQTLLSEYAFPLYILMRLLSLIFIEFNIQLCESTTVYALIFFLKLLKQKKLIKKCETIEDVQKPSKKKSIIPQIKKDNQHTVYSYQKNSNQDKSSPMTANIKINIKDAMREGTEPIPQFHSKLRPGFKSQLSHLIFDRNDHQLSNFYQNIVNIMPQGVILMNKFQQIQFISQKCEKLLQCDGKERVLEYIKKCLSNCELSEEISIMKRSNNQKGKITQNVLEDIIRHYKQNQEELDIFDVLLNPNKYLSTLEIDCKNSVGSAYISQSSFYQENSFCFETILENDDEEQEKRLKFILVLTYMTMFQLEGISQSVVSYSKEKKITSTECLQPVLLILIKNTTHKIQVQELKKERLVNNTLLKSFSHELRTPLNSSLHMLNIIQDTCKDNKIKLYATIAKSSIKLLIYQINDILDFAAFQSQSFSYHVTTFKLVDLFSEINELYFEQSQNKGIMFEIQCDQTLKELQIINDQQRIMQILVNLLNNSFKYTKQNGEVIIAFKQKQNNQIKIVVKDNGIGIQQSKLEIIRKQFCKPSSKLSLDYDNSVNQLGLGLKISGTICQGLNQLESSLNIKSYDQNGTKVSFMISNQENDNNLQEGLLSPIPSHATGRFELLSPLYSQIQCNSCLSSMSQIKQSQLKLESPQNDQSSIMKENIDSPRINDCQNTQLVIPVSKYNFKSWINNVKRESSTISFQVNPQKSQCENCAQILIVDDIPFNQIAFSSLLEHFNILTESAYDGFQAVEMVKKKLTKHCKYYKIIFMDIEMPIQNGFQTSKIIASIINFQSIIVMCSAYDTIENYSLAKNAGISEFLSKPVNKKELERILLKYQFKI